MSGKSHGDLWAYLTPSITQIPQISQVFFVSGKSHGGLWAYLTPGLTQIPQVFFVGGKSHGDLWAYLTPGLTQISQISQVLWMENLTETCGFLCEGKSHGFL